MTTRNGEPSCPNCGPHPEHEGRCLVMVDTEPVVRTINGRLLRAGGSRVQCQCIQGGDE